MSGQRAATIATGREAPLYTQLCDALIHDIEGGRYPVGALLPPELELAERHAVSRHTVREAMRRLVAMGVVDRQQGVGTRVRSIGARTRYVASINALDDLFEYTRQTRLDVIDEQLVAATSELAELLRCRPGQRWLSFATRRYPIDDSLPIAHMTAYVPPAFEDVRDHLHEEGVSVYRLLAERFGQRIADVHQQVEAIPLGDEVAALLDAEPGSPALRVSRRYLGPDGRLVTASVNIHPSDRFTLVTGWRLDWHPPAADA